MKGIFYAQSEYSMLDNAIPIDVLVHTAKARGHGFLALSDTSNLHAVSKFFSACQEADVKPIIGIRAFVESELSEHDSVLIYATSDIGYRHLLKIGSAIQLHPFKLLTLETLSAYKKDVLVISSGIDSMIDKAILNDNLVEAHRLIALYQSHSESFYLGLSVQTLTWEIKVAPQLARLATRLDIPLLPVSKMSYVNIEDKEIHETLLKIGNENKEVIDDGDFHIKSIKEIEDDFNEYPYALDTASRLVAPIKLHFKTPSITLPQFPVPHQASSKDYLSALCHAGLKKRCKMNNKNVQNYIERLQYELKVISDMGFEDYFLIVWDFVKFAKHQHIMVGPGRGSAAGSLVAYVLGITNVDPIEHILLFERFLNPERISMPDIDLDFPDDRRDEVIHYVAKRYGHHRVAHIVTFGTFAVRSAIRDTARVKRMPLHEVDILIKQLPAQITSLKDIEKTPLYLSLDEDALAKTVLTTARKLEGLPRHTSTHAAGIILSHQELTDIIPVQEGPEGLLQAQFEATDLEKMGLLKIDFLGLRNLTVIAAILKMIKEHQNIDVDIHKLHNDDLKTYSLLSKGLTNGIFQLESTGIRKVLINLKPNQFEDLVAVLALYRPGPMENIQEFILRKNGKKFQFLHPALEPILAPTYGIIVYQEQIMRIAHEFAGYTLGEADILRRAVSKKQRTVLEEERERFVKQCHNKGYTVDIGETVYDYIVKFADYGFNRSHSVAYALISYQMAYLKANYPLFFMTILLGSVVGNERQVEKYVNEARALGISIKPPSVNSSHSNFNIESDAIRFPLLAIKGIGLATVTKLLEERDHKPFSSFEDLKQRTSSMIHTKTMETLIFSCALDEFKLSKKALIESIEHNVTEFNRFLDHNNTPEKQEEYSIEYLLQKEKDVMGFNLMMTPLEPYKEAMKKNHWMSTSELNGPAQKAVIIGYIKRVKTLQTKQNETMAFLTITDGKTELDTVVFPKVYATLNMHMSDKISLFQGDVTLREDKLQYVLSNIRMIGEIDKDED